MTVAEFLAQASRAVHVLAAGEDITGHEADATLEAFNARLQGAVSRPLSATDLNAAAVVRPGFDYQVDAGVGAFTITFPADPREGKVIGLADARSYFAASGPSINPNGYKFEGSRSTRQITTPGRWVFFSHSADWWRIADLALGDEFPLPPDLIAPFRDLLAVELAALNSVPVPDALKVRLEGSAMAMKRFG